MDMDIDRTKKIRKTKKITRDCVECGATYEQTIVDWGDKELTTDDYDEYCEECNQRAMR